MSGSVPFGFANFPAGNDGPQGVGDGWSNLLKTVLGMGQPAGQQWQGQPGVTTAEGLGDTASKVGQWIGDQRAQSSQMGMWNDQTGTPTPFGIHSALMNIALGTNSAGGGIRAYHGSPHDFDAFDASKIGTGEGNQTYGRGLYFAGNEAVAKEYRDNLAAINPEFRAAQQEYNTASDAVQRAATSGSDEEFYAALAAQRAASDKASGIPQTSPNPSPGHMYEVNIAANPDHFLDWNKPLNQQSDHVRQAIANSPYAGYEKTRLPGGQLAPQTAEGAQALASYGIPGIRYLDAGSRATGEGASNHVVFDPATIEIIRKYGLAGLMASGGATAGAQSQ